MRKSRRIGAALHAALLTAAFALVSAGGAEAVQYRFDSPLTYVAPGQQCTLSVLADSPGDSLGCVECWITWDPARVTLISGSDGTLFQNAGFPKFFSNHAIAADTFSVEGCLLGYRTYALTPGQVARFVFRADQEGVCPVRIARFNLWDIDRNLLDPVFDPNAWIVVGNPATGAGPVPFRGLEVSAHPNPFNPSTTIEVRAQSGTRVCLDIYDAAGNAVRRLFDGEMRGDAASFQWNGRASSGARLPSGIYFVSAVSGASRATHKIVLVQ